jgi:hypothetical protein
MIFLDYYGKRENSYATGLSMPTASFVGCLARGLRQRHRHLDIGVLLKMMFLKNHEEAMIAVVQIYLVSC